MDNLRLGNVLRGEARARRHLVKVAKSKHPAVSQEAREELDIIARKYDAWVRAAITSNVPL